MNNRCRESACRHINKAQCPKAESLGRPQIASFARHHPTHTEDQIPYASATVYLVIPTPKCDILSATCRHCQLTDIRCREQPATGTGQRRYFVMCAGQMMYQLNYRHVQRGVYSLSQYFTVVRDEVASLGKILHRIACSTPHLVGAGASRRA
jgi:hypothetical protein